MTSDEELRHMQASAARYLDDFYRHNQAMLDKAAEKVRAAIIALGIEVVGLVAALLVTLVH